MSRLVQTGECAHCNLSLSSNLWTPCLTCCPLPLFLSPRPAVPFSSLYHHCTSSPPSTPSPFALSLSLSHFIPALPQCTWSQPAASWSHLTCSPLRLSDTQHLHDETGRSPFLAHESLNYYSVWECMWAPLQYLRALKHVFLSVFWDSTTVETTGYKTTHSWMS